MDMPIVDAVGIYSLSSSKTTSTIGELGDIQFISSMADSGCFDKMDFVYFDENAESRYFIHGAAKSLLVMKLKDQDDFNRVLLEISARKFCKDHL